MYATAASCHPPMPVACKRTGFPEIRPCKDGAIRLELGVLQVGAPELAVCPLWHSLRFSHSALVLHHQALPLQHGLSDGVAQLCVRHDSRDAGVPRRGEPDKMAGRAAHHGRMLLHSKVKTLSPLP